MPRCWGWSTLGRLFRVAALLAAAACLVAAADLKTAVGALERGDARQALHLLLAEPSRKSPVADYIAYWTAQAHFQLKNYGDVGPALEPLWALQIASPVAGKAAVLGARAAVEAGNGEAALRMLKRAPSGQLPEPQALLVEARARLLTGETQIAADRFQAVYYGYPLSDEARDASEELARLSGAPAVPGVLRLARARKLNESRQAERAQNEYEDLVTALSGEEREMARVGVGAALYQQRKTEAAVRQLKDLELTGVDAEAERLYWLAACYSRLDENDAMLATVEELARRAPASPWRLKALVLAGNSLLVENDTRRYPPLYAACARDFPDSDQAAYCHWKVAWRAYLDRRADVHTLMVEHLRRYPSSEKAGAAVYYLGRLAEDAHDTAAARHYFEELITRFPNYYYAHQARERLGRLAAHGTNGSTAAGQVLSSIAWPERERKPAFTASDPATRLRLERGRMLARAGLDNWAESELRFAARQGGVNRFVLAMELSEMAARRRSTDVSVRHIMGAVPDYLWIPRDAAPRRFWQLAFPFPYRAQIERLARQNDLDPFLVAALIRQESLFNPDAVSVSNAIGLMQVMPGTGRELGRKVGLKGVRPATLKRPDVNLKLGTYYLRRQLDARNGSVEETLAGYNAGPTRIPVWKTWAEYREPSEFVETIPFTQTRDYVQIILRNADFYRWLYAGTVAPAEPEVVDKKPAATKKTAAPSKKKLRKAKRRK